MKITRVVHMTVLVSLSLVYEYPVAVVIWSCWIAAVKILGLPLLLIAWS